jgi:hypothetical protein
MGVIENGAQISVFQTSKCSFFILDNALLLLCISMGYVRLYPLKPVPTEVFDNVHTPSGKQEKS